MWPCHLVLNGPPVLPMYYFISFFVVTVALYITFFVRHLLSIGHWFLSLQLQSYLSVSVFYPSNFFMLRKVFLLCPRINIFILLIQLYDNLQLFLFIKLLKLLICLKCLFIKSKNIFSTFVFTDLQNGGLKQIILPGLFIFFCSYLKSAV